MTAHFHSPVGQIEGKCRGRRCFILGSGSSLDGVDLSLLRKEFVIALNWSYLLVHGFKHAWWMWCDLRTYREVKPRLEGRVKKVRAILAKKAMEAMRSYRGTPASVVALGANAEFTPKRTVAETAVVAADFLGFSETVLVGVDGFVPSEHGVPYCAALKRESCHFMKVGEQDSWKRSARHFNKEMTKVMARVKTTRVIQTSPLYQGDLFEYESLGSVMARRLDAKVDAVPYLGL